MIEIIGPLLALLSEVGKMVNFHNSNAVLERIEELKRIYEQELAKGPGRDDALVYSLRLELRNICNLYCAALKGSATKG